MTTAATKPPDPDLLLKLTASMRALGVSGFDYAGARVSFWQPMPAVSPRPDLRNVDPGADAANYSEADLFGDPEDPDAR